MKKLKIKHSLGFHSAAEVDKFNLSQMQEYNFQNHNEPSEIFLYSVIGPSGTWKKLFFDLQQETWKITTLLSDNPITLPIASLPEVILKVGDINPFNNLPFECTIEQIIIVYSRNTFLDDDPSSKLWEPPIPLIGSTKTT